MTTHTEHKGEAMTDIVQQLKWWATEETEWTCTGGHDLCHGGTSAGSECPYCDKSITTEGEMMLGAVSEIETLRAENERLRKEREPLQRQVDETFCMFLDRGNELVFLHERLAAAERVVEAIRRYDTTIRTESSALPTEYRDALAAYDQGKVTI